MSEWRHDTPPGPPTPGRGGGLRYDAGKPRLDLIPAGFVAEVMHFFAVDPPISLMSTNHPALCALRVLHCFQTRERNDANSVVPAAVLFGTQGLLDCARVLDFGITKYSAWNWALGMPWSKPIGCAMRHLLAMHDDPDALDAESGLPHRGHVVCNLLFLWWYAKHCPQLDDRMPAL